MTAAKRPAVRWPFLVLAAIPLALFAWALWLIYGAGIERALAVPGAIKGWAITLAIAAGMIAIPARTYRFALLLFVVVLVLALLII